MFDNIEKMPAVVIFDWDNTLLDAWGEIHNCLMDTVRHFNKDEWDVAKTKQIMETPASKHMFDIFGDNEKEAMRYYRSRFLKYLKNDLFLLPNAKDVVDFLYNIKIPMSIVSNKYGPLLRSEIEKLKMTHYFHKIIGSGDTKFDKPDKHPVDRALEFIDYSGDVWFIGDTIIDMECAHVSGCVPILYGSGKEYILESEYPPIAQVKEHSDLLEILKKLNNE